MEEKRLQEALQTLKKYKSENAAIYAKAIEAEQWYKLRHWEYMKKGNSDDIEPTSAWLVNSLMNKHADAMDNYPEPVFLPREESDTETAAELSAVVPVIIEQNNFEDSYDKNWWTKLKTGTAIYSVTWDKDKLNGLGDVSINKCSILNLFWKGGITDIQNSPNFFHVNLVDNDDIKTLFGEDIELGDSVNAEEWLIDEKRETEQTAIIDWYYKKLNKDGTRVLHLCQFVGNHVIYSSEDEDADTPFYADNKYPFVFDVLFPIEDCASGFGYIDLVKDSQRYIDKLQQTILKNAIEATRRRYFISRNCNVNVDDFLDTTKEVVQVNGNVDDERIREITTVPLSSVYVNVLDNKIAELKETSGNREWQQGNTASGVTAASAIAALMEAGSKLSRDMIKSTYRANNQIIAMVVERIRQFYDSPRKFRITQPDGEMDFTSFSNKGMTVQTTIEMGQEHSRLPIFDIRIKSQKANPFSQASINEEAKEMFARGMFNPQLADQTVIALQMMSFEGKDKVLKMVSENGTLYQTVMQQQQQIEQMSQIIGQMTGQNLDPMVQQSGREAEKQGRPKEVSEKPTEAERARQFAERERREAAAAQEI